jgi:ATP phosphoribosyltransferase
VLSDGLILSSQAQLAASLHADWDPLRLDVARRLLRILEARARARRTATLTWPAEADAAARATVDALAAAGAKARPFGVLIAGRDVFDVTAALAAAGVGPVTVANPAYVFEAVSEVTEELVQRLAR